MKYLIVSLVSYLLGSIPFSYIVVKLARGIDVRSLGSGNAGTLNTWRVTRNPLLTLIVLIGDVGKGALSILFARYFGGDAFSEFLAAFFAVSGHNWPVWLNFRGGRGLATMYGAYLVSSPYALLATIVIWAITYLLTGYVILGGIIAIPVIVGAFYYLGYIPPAVLGAAFPAMLGLAPKWTRIMEGKEPKHFWTLKGEGSARETKGKVRKTKKKV